MSDYRPRNGAGALALWAGLLALAFAFFPFVGEFVSVPTALVAVGTGVAGLCVTAIVMAATRT